MREKNPLLQGITSIFGNRHQMFKLMLGFFGGVSLFFGGLMLPLSLTGDMVEGASRWGGVLMGLFFLAVSAFCLIKLYTVNRRDRRFKRYQALIGKQKRIPLGWDEVQQGGGRPQHPSGDEPRLVFGGLYRREERASALSQRFRERQADHRAVPELRRRRRGPFGLSG